MPRVAALLVVLGATGCTKGLEAYDVFIDLRVLGMAASPPEVLLNAPAPLATVFSALVVDPRGGPIDYTWTFCPVQSSVACDDFETQLADIAPADQALLRQLRSLSLSDTANPTTSPEGAPYYDVHDFDLGSVSSAMFGSDITPELWAFHVRDSLLNQGSGVWPSAILSLRSSHGDALTAEKRVVLGVEDLAAIAAPLASAFGFTICPPPPQTQPPNCLAFAPRVANSSPSWGTTQLVLGGDPRGPFTDAPTPLPPLKVGQKVRLVPSFTPASSEQYQTLSFNFQTHQAQVDTYTEQPSVSWFCSDGTLDNALTWPKFTKNLSNVYTAPDAVPTHDNGVATIWLVGRDQRGGESWQALSVPITP